MKSKVFSIGNLVEVQGHVWPKGRMGIITDKILKQHPLDGELMFYEVLFSNEVRATCFESNMTLISGKKENK